MRGALGEEKGGVIDPPSYDLQISEGFENLRLEDLRMEETPADDLARPAPPPQRGAGGGLIPPRGVHRRPPASLISASCCKAFMSLVGETESFLCFSWCLF